MNNQTQFARPFPPGVCAIGRPAIPPVGRAAAINDPEQTPSLPAGGRSLMGGCATAGVKLGLRAALIGRFIYRAIRPSRLFIQHQTDSHSRAGKARWGRCDYRPAVGRTGRRFAGLGCHRRGFEFPAPRGYDLLTRLGGGFGPRPFGQFDGIGRRANVTFANLIHNTTTRFTTLSSRSNAISVPPFATSQNLRTELSELTKIPSEHPKMSTTADFAQFAMRSRLKEVGTAQSDCEPFEYDDEIDGDECGNCGGEGFTYHCIDGCCVDAEEGCDLCASRCDWCNPPRPRVRTPHPSSD